jgi:hypothetical protein
MPANLFHAHPLLSSESRAIVPPKRRVLTMHASLQYKLTAAAVAVAARSLFQFWRSRYTRHCTYNDICVLYMYGKHGRGPAPLDCAPPDIVQATARTKALQVLLSSDPGAQDGRASRCTFWPLGHGRREVKDASPVPQPRVPPGTGSIIIGAARAMEVRRARKGRRGLCGIFGRVCGRRCCRREARHAAGGVHLTLGLPGVTCTRRSVSRLRVGGVALVYVVSTCG